MFAIAIDGPAGAGKSTIAKAVAQKLGIHYVDTGAMYRTIGYALSQQGIDLHEESKVSEALPKLKIRIHFVQGRQEMIVNGSNVTDEIRTVEVGAMASLVGTYGAVRDMVLQMERELSDRYEVIMDGRDIGTVVLPQAPLKIYLTADAAERGRRRYLELEAKNPGGCVLSEVIASVIRRDQQDMNRTIAPLRQADDAILVDTTHLSLEESINTVLALAEPFSHHE